MITENGIVLTEVNYGETSKIINILTEHHGVIGVYAKGARTLKSKFRTTSSKLTYGQFFIKYNKEKMSYLNDVTVINNFKNIMKDIIKIGYANYLLDLTNQVIKEGITDYILPNLLSALKKIDNGMDPKIITSIIEIKYLENLGVMPILDSCVSCGTKTNIATISSYKGGFLCNDCKENEPIISEKAIKLIRLFSLVDIEKIDKLEISDSVIEEITNFIDDYYERYTGLYMKTKQFLKSLIK
ncbi:MAG: DNA repair protein RecO [Bacilli bacterium]